MKRKKKPSLPSLPPRHTPPPPLSSSISLRVPFSSFLPRLALLCSLDTSERKGRSGSRVCVRVGSSMQGGGGRGRKGLFKLKSLAHYALFSDPRPLCRRRPSPPPSFSSFSSANGPSLPPSSLVFSPFVARTPSFFPSRCRNFLAVWARKLISSGLLFNPPFFLLFSTQAIIFCTLKKKWEMGRSQGSVRKDRRTERNSTEKKGSNEGECTSKTAALHFLRKREWW